MQRDYLRQRKGGQESPIIIPSPKLDGTIFTSTDKGRKRISLPASGAVSPFRDFRPDRSELGSSQKAIHLFSFLEERRTVKV